MWTDVDPELSAAVLGSDRSASPLALRRTGHSVAPAPGSPDHLLSRARQPTDRVRRLARFPLQLPLAGKLFAHSCATRGRILTTRDGATRDGGERMGLVKTFAAIVVAASAISVAGAMAQTQPPPPAAQTPPGAGEERPGPGEEKRIEGQVRTVDPSGTEITLTDGTKLTTPPRTTLKPGVLTEGAIVIASYREENGKNVLTELALKEPSASPPGGPSSPGRPSTAPTQSPNRY
jgi:hypothetical protein